MLTTSSHLTPTALRLLLQICDYYVAEYDANFNPDESEFLVILANKRVPLYNAMCNRSFFVGNKKIITVDSFSHLGNFITASLRDGDDIIQ
jgi:hypothetical protein